MGRCVITLSELLFKCVKNAKKVMMKGGNTFHSKVKMFISTDLL